jgi:hypothetical protein
VTVRILYLMFVRLRRWMALLARPAASEDAWRLGSAARHIEDFDPDLATALVRCNPEGGPGINARQVARMARLSEWCHKTGRTFLFELLVPPTTAETGSARPLFEADMVVHAAGRAPSTTVSPPPSGYSMVPA